MVVDILFCSFYNIDFVVDIPICYCLQGFGFGKADNIYGEDYEKLTLGL